MSKNTILTLLEANACDAYMLTKVPFCIYLDSKKQGAGFLTLTPLTTIPEETLEQVKHEDRQ